MFMPVFPRHARRAVLVAVVLILAPAFLACADVERTVTYVSPITTDDGVPIRWESDRYPAVAVKVENDCWDVAVVGEPVPDVCVTAHALAMETNPYREFRWVAHAGTALAIAVLALVAWRRVGLHPVVDRTNTGEPTPHHFDEDAAVALMRHSEAERSARIAAEPSRHDPSHPFIRGALLTLAGLVLPVLLFGYGRTLGWAVNTGIVLLLLTAPPMALLQLTFLRPANVDAAIARGSFLCGAVVPLLFGAFFGLLFVAPLLNLNGIDWPN